MDLLWLVVILLIIFSIMGVPQSGIWNHRWGYAPSGTGIILVILLVAFLLYGRR